MAKDWKEIGTRRSLSKLISEITTIDESVLHDPSARREFSLAQRMSWASMRQTTRIEDQAYCLMGLFDVNMPLLYGERQHAFTRLQTTILSSSDDCSILAWESKWNHWTGRPRENFFEPSQSQNAYTTNILAKSVSQFCSSGRVEALAEDTFSQGDFEQDLGHRGISIIASGKWTDIKAPIFGPLDPKGAHRGGLAKVLSPDGSDYIRRHGYWLRNGRPSTTFDEYFTRQENYRYPNWARTHVMITGKYQSLHEQEIPRVFSTEPPCPDLFIAILLVRTEENTLKRLHWPPLIIVDLTQGNGEKSLLDKLRSWPLTQVRVHTLLERDREEHFTPILKSVPLGFEIITKDKLKLSRKSVDPYFESHSDANSINDSESEDVTDPFHYHYDYTSPTAPHQALREAAPRLTFSGSSSPYPEFTIHIDWRHKHRIPKAHVALGQSQESSEESVSWISLEWGEKSMMQLTEKLAVSVRRRPAAANALELLDINIEDMPPMLLPSVSLFHEQVPSEQAALSKEVLADALRINLPTAEWDYGCGGSI